MINDNFHDILPSVYLFDVFFFQKVTPINILINYRGNEMEEEDGSPLLLTTIIGTLSYHYLEE